jgi:hypothetical protein
MELDLRAKVRASFGGGSMELLIQAIDPLRQVNRIQYRSLSIISRFMSILSLVTALIVAKEAVMHTLGVLGKN